MVDKLQLTLTTGRTIGQGIGKEKGKTSKEYFENTAVCFLDPSDMDKLGIKSSTNVKVTSKHGSVVVKCKKYVLDSMRGILFMPCGLWANMITGDETCGAGTPQYKGFPVEIEPAPNTDILSIKELLMKEYGRTE